MTIVSGSCTNATTKVFIGNLAWKTTNEDLVTFVEPIGNVLSANVQRHSDTLRSKGWGLIEFMSLEDANAAVDQLNASILNNRQVYLRLDQGLQEPKDKGVGLFVGNIPWNTAKDELLSLFAQFNPQDCVIATNMMGKSRGFSIVTFETVEDVKRAITEMHSKNFNGRVLECHMDSGQKRKKRTKPVAKSKIFVGNLSSDMDEESVKSVFSQAGNISSISLKQSSETEKFWCIITFASDSEAAAAIQLFNGTLRPGSSLPWIVRFDRKTDISLDI